MVVKARTVQSMRSNLRPVLVGHEFYTETKRAPTALVDESSDDKSENFELNFKPEQ